MRPIGCLNPLEEIPQPPDTMANYVMVGGTAQAADWPANTQLVRFRAATTAGAAASVVVNMMSTSATWPAATVTATTASTGLNTFVTAGYELIYQVSTGGSTGFSIISGASCLVSVEFWRK